MNFDILWPVKWVIELLLVSFHTLFTALGMDPNLGLTWVVSIVGLVLVVRAALIPVFVKQIKSQRNMLLAQPELAKLQKKYKGKTDRESREKFAQEQMALYKSSGSNPFSSCIPLLIQMPIFGGLFFVLNEAQHGTRGVGLLSSELAKSFAVSDLFGAPLSATFMNSELVAVKILAATMILLMTASQFITQRQIMAKNQNPDVNNSQYMQTQKIMLYVFPIIFAISGISFPLGVMFYWLTSNFWTMGQQFIVIRNMPTPGSIAHKAQQQRLLKKGKITVEQVDATVEEAKPISSVKDLEEEGDIAADYLEELLDIFDLDGDIDIDVRQGRAYVGITAEGASNLKLIADPKTVDALQELTRLAVQVKTTRFSRLVLDISGSRQARVEQLSAMVQREIDKVRESGAAKHLAPMSSYERKIVHDLVEESGLSSESEGEGKDRHIVISPK
jgi:YidC/Oxa1 family membrane protein insertase